MKKEHRIWNIVENIVYYALLIPLVIITLSIVYQSIAFPDKIPNIFGYKIFMVLDNSMDESIKPGDLIFTKNIDTETLKKNDVIGFRNNADTVTIYKIIDISNEQVLDKETNENKTIKLLKMNAPENATKDLKLVNASKVEGIVTRKIPGLGLIIYNMQKPIVLAVIIIVILIIGGIAYYIAAKLDEKDEKNKK